VWKEDELVEEINFFDHSNRNAMLEANRYPKVSIFWLNYNSMRIKDIVLSSLESVCKLNYPNFELIVVDNGSRDGSYEMIKRFLSVINVNTHIKLIRLRRNVGFTGGNNIAYKFMDPQSKYFVLLNNDAVIYPDSISKLVEVMEADDTLGAAQGIILNYYNDLVDSAGGLIDDALGVHIAYCGLPPSNMRKTLNVSYADGAFSIYRVNAAKKALECENKIFDDNLFAYFEDASLGLKLWNTGYKIKSFPFIAAKHARSSTSRGRQQFLVYILARNHIALALSSNTKFKMFILIFHLRKLIVYFIRYRKNPILIRAYITAIIDGIKMGRRKIYGGIDVYNANVIRMPLKRLILGALLLRRLLYKDIKIY
jgi:GT2 family glycosyltransferase